MVITYAQMERLEDLAESTPSRVQIKKKARVTKLVKDDSGAVIGAEYEHQGKTHTAYGPVILATGGYAADFTSDSLLKKYRPDMKSTTNFTVVGVDGGNNDQDAPSVSEGVCPTC